MKHMKAFLYGLYPAFPLFAVLFAFTTILNRHYGESWRMFWIDAMSDFVDNPVYCPYYSHILFFLLILISAVFLSRAVFCLIGLSCTLRVQIGRMRFTLGSFQRKPKWKTVLFRTAALSLSVLSCSLCGYTLLSELAETPRRQNLWPGDTLVGHAFGAIDGYNYTNSFEAFQLRYEQGIRTFEVDLAITSDEQVVLAHEYPYSDPPTLEEFLHGPTMGHYLKENKTTVSTPHTPMSFADLCLLMRKYPDIWIMTDSKYTDPQNIKTEFHAMVNTARAVNAEEVLDRLIIQIYNERMYDILQEIYPFKSFLFTLYRRWYGDSLSEFTDICRWCYANHVDLIGTWAMEPFYSDETKAIAERYGLGVYVYTINRRSVAKSYLEKGALGVYTDVLNHADVVI